MSPLLPIILPVLLALLHGGMNVRAQAPAAGQCTYSFTLAEHQVRSICGANDYKAASAEIKADYDRMKAENEALKGTVEKLRLDYEGMVAGVLKMEKETSAWREVVAWPNLEPSLRPDNSSIITVDSPAFADCWDAWNGGHKKPGVYKIKPAESFQEFYAFCDKEGWLVFQRRFDGEENFYRTWDQYSRGFGNVIGEFYLGNENIHMVTAQKPYELRVEMVGWNSKVYHGNYDDFSLGSETEEYALHIGNMSKGNYLDVLTPLNDVGFTARDHDNDKWYSSNCADYYRGGWWLTNCGFDLHRGWCNGPGCMSWGSKTVKKSQLKLRPMSANGGGVYQPPVDFDPEVVAPSNTDDHSSVGLREGDDDAYDNYEYREYDDN